jgi:hypothetical protein
MKSWHVDAPRLGGRLLTVSCVQANLFMFYSDSEFWKKLLDDPEYNPERELLAK